MFALPDGALSGLKVVDLSRVLSGPYCTQILADHGAEVIKVEPPAGDEVRHWGPPFEHDMASYFIGINRNKRSISVDMRTPEGREILHRLLDGADILIENFKPGTMDRWGVGYNDLKDRYPSLVYCRITGFGEDGPFGGYPGYDAILQAMCGLMSINGEPGGSGTRLGIPLVDMCCGLYAAIGILMAAVERQSSGKGQFIDLSLYDTALSLLHPYAANYFLNGKRPQSSGNAHPNISPYDKFPTGTCDIFLGIGNDRAFQRFCRELGCDHLLADERFASNALRVVNREALRADLVAALAEHDGQELCQRLLKMGIPAGPVLTVDEALALDHTAHRGMLAEKDWYRGLFNPVNFSRSKSGQVAGVPPTLGQHTREVLRQHGYAEAEIDKLLDLGVAITTGEVGAEGAPQVATDVSGEPAA